VSIDPIDSISLRRKFPEIVHGSIRPRYPHAPPALAHDPGAGLIVLPDTFNLTNRDLIIPLSTRYGVPAVSNNPIYAESGALITYGVDFTELFRQAAGYIDRILKGAMPADLPVQNPTKFELVINLKTAKALGLKVPQSLSASADHVIE
jgi:putative ABC transport system substrate-binding protein